LSLDGTFEGQLDKPFVLVFIQMEFDTMAKCTSMVQPNIVFILILFIDNLVPP